MVKDHSTLCIAPDGYTRDAVTCIERGKKSIALVVDAEGRRLATVTDGDVRRALLAGKKLYTPVSELLAAKPTGSYSEPIIAPVGTDADTLLRLMREKVVRHIPLVDGAGRVVDLAMMNELLPDQMGSLQAVIMAGGSGIRLRPLTEDLPKPMLPVGDRPLMELIVEQLRQARIRQVLVTTRYKPEKIIEHFGDGEEFGIEINYLNEHRPLGTAGALGLMPEPNQPIIMINGDILTQVDFRAMLAYHQEHGADMTVGVSHYSFKVPYGVVECDGPKVLKLSEKPQMTFSVNAGIYLLEPLVYEYIPQGQPFDMTDLIHWLLDAGRQIVSFPILEYWLDIGHHDDYVQAQKDVEEGRMAVEFE